MPPPSTPTSMAPSGRPELRDQDSLEQTGADRGRRTTLMGTRLLLKQFPLARPLSRTRPSNRRRRRGHGPAVSIGWTNHGRHLAFVRKSTISFGIIMRMRIAACLVSCAVMIGDVHADERGGFVCSERSGTWSAATTWQGGSVPRTGARVRIRAGHTVTYDVCSDEPIRMIHVAGTLTFATDRNTRLDVGLIRIQAGETTGEDGFDCDAHDISSATGAARPALEVGTSDHPIAADAVANIRLVLFEGMDRETSPAIVCCGGRMDFHGAPMRRTWVKLGRALKKGDTTVSLAEPVTGWRVGDRVIVTATQRDRLELGTLRPGAGGRRSFTEERILTGQDAQALTLDQPLAHPHESRGDYRGEVANLSRNVVIESADPMRTAGTPCITAARKDPSRTPSFVTWARKACWASTASTSTWPATRCADHRLWGPRSGTAAIDGSRSTPRTTSSFETAWGTVPSAMVSTWRMDARPTTFSTGILQSRRLPASRWRANFSSSTAMTGEGSGGRTA